MSTTATTTDLIIPDELAAALDRATGPVALKTQSGRTLGRYTPEPLCPWDPTLTPEEAERIANEPGGCTLAEIWKRLGVK
jgi:hypothetical protein